MCKSPPRRPASLRRAGSTATWSAYPNSRSPSRSGHAVECGLHSVMGSCMSGLRSRSRRPVKLIRRFAGLPPSCALPPNASRMPDPLFAGMRSFLVSAGSSPRTRGATDSSSSRAPLELRSPPQTGGNPSLKARRFGSKTFARSPHRAARFCLPLQCSEEPEQKSRLMPAGTPRRLPIQELGVAAPEAGTDGSRRAEQRLRAMRAG